MLEGTYPDASEFTVFLEDDLGQAGAAREDSIFDASNTIRDCNARQTSATSEGLLSDAGEFTIFTKSNARQAGAPPKSLFPNTDDAVRDVDAY